MESGSKGPERVDSLYQRTVGPLRRYLSRLLGNPTEAQDVAHDAYIRILPTLRKDEAEKPEALLYVTARRLAFNRIRHRKVVGPTEDSTRATGVTSPQPGVVEQVMARQELGLMEQAIRELPPGCRAVLLLRKVEHLSHAEIAQRLGIAVSTVEKQHARALRLLKASLPEETLRRFCQRRAEGGSSHE